MTGGSAATALSGDAAAAATAAVTVAAPDLGVLTPAIPDASLGGAVTAAKLGEERHVSFDEDATPAPPPITLLKKGIKCPPGPRERWFWAVDKVIGQIHVSTLTTLYLDAITHTIAAINVFTLYNNAPYQGK